MKFEELQTDRLALRKFTQDTYDVLFSHCTEQEICNYLGLNSKEEFLKEKTKHQNSLTTFNKKLLYFQLIDKADKKIIGWCGYHTWYIEHKRAEIGYGLFENQYKGKGFMTEAIIPIVDFGFEIMNLHRIEAMVSPDNIPSLKLLRKLNFKEEGHLREHYVEDGKAEDSLVFSLLKTDGVETHKLSEAFI